MTAKILNFKRPVNGVLVEQRRADGFINATAMCVAHGRRINTWFRTKDTLELFATLALDQGVLINCSDLSNLDVTSLSASKYAEIFPSIILSKGGSPKNGGGVWLHPDLAIQLAQWCNKPFAIQVSRWVREWMTIGQSPIHLDLEQEFIAWQQRYDIRIYLKDFLRPELMRAVVEWAEIHGKSPRVLCSQVHDAMNERIQGAKSQQIRLLGGLPLSALIRDYFGAPPLLGYVAINKLAANAIQDKSIHPVMAVHEACDAFLGKRYTPALAPILENVHTRGRRLEAEKRRRQDSQPVQMSLDLDQAS